MRFRLTKNIGVGYIINESLGPNISAHELSNKQSSRQLAGVWPIRTSEVEAVMTSHYAALDPIPLVRLPRDNCGLGQL